VYYYPVMQRSTIRPQRTKNIARTIGITDEDEQIIDQLDILLDEPTEELKLASEKFKEDPYGFHMMEEEEEEVEVPEHASEQGEEEHEEHGDGHTNGENGAAHHEHDDEDLDAEGEMD
jgi:RNA polymerase II-associated factor 1